MVNNDWDIQIGEKAKLVVELEMQTLEKMESLDAVHQTLSKLTELLAEAALILDD